MELVAETKKVKSYRNDGVNALKFWLMPFVCIASFGLKIPGSDYIEYLSMFAPAAFFILCGFTAASREEKENKLYPRLIKRTLISFVILFAVLLAFNILMCVFKGTLSDFVSVSLKKRTVFNFVVLCIWPYKIGKTIWFLQALLYARIIMWLMNKMKIMRFYIVIMILAMTSMILFGELAGLLHFNVHGYKYIMCNGIPEAISYMLLGRLLYRSRERLLSIHSYLYILIFVLGGIASVREIMALSNAGYLVYTGHIVGYGIMAFGACGFFLKQKRIYNDFATLHGKSYSRRIYALSQPVGYGFLMLVSLLYPVYYEPVKAFAGLLVYAICFGLSYFFGYMRFRIQLEETDDE